MMAPRNRLPNRRPAVNEEIDFAGMRLTATVGFDTAGRPAEVLLAGAKAGTDLAHLLADAAVAISVALQCGVPASALRKSVGRVPETIDGPATPPASPIGAPSICWRAKSGATSMSDDPGKSLRQLRDRLVALRGETLGALAAADAPDAGLIALVGNITGAVAALDAELLEHVPPAETPSSRGGDRQASARAVRDGAIRQLAGLLDGDMSLAEQTREIRRKAARYQPAAGDESGEPQRRALHRIAETGLGVPGRKQVGRIIGRAANTRPAYRAPK